MIDHETGIDERYEAWINTYERDLEQAFWEETGKQAEDNCKEFDWFCQRAYERGDYQSEV